MRILLVSEDIPYPNMGGLAKHVLTLARALVKEGHTVDLLGGTQHPIEVCGEEAQFGGTFIAELSGQHAGWKENSLGMYVPPKRSAIARKFAKIILRHAPRYDVVHYHGHIPNVGRYIPANVNFIQTRHDQGSDCFLHTRFNNGAICTTADPRACARCINVQPNAVQRFVSATAVVRFRKEVAQSFQRHKTIFVSDLLANNFSRTMGPGNWGITVHNFADRERLESLRANAPKNLGAQLRVFIAAKLYPAKGVEVFLRTLKPQLREHMHITIAGDGPDESRLRAEFENEQIRFLGWCAPNDTLHHAAQADAIVVPSVWEEPCATTVLEGLFLGKPTFALATGGTPELTRYAADPAQLRLHPDMQTLVADLTCFVPQEFGYASPGLGSAGSAATALLKIYAQPRAALI